MIKACLIKRNITKDYSSSNLQKKIEVGLNPIAIESKIKNIKLQQYPISNENKIDQ